MLDITAYLPAKRKLTPSGWISFNAPCCVHNGESADTRGRGGFISSAPGTINYHCFNCGYKASYTPGYHLSYRFRKLLSWLGADENTIRLLVFEAIRTKDSAVVENTAKEVRSFKRYSMPADAVNICHSTEALALEYLINRKIDIFKYDFYVSKSLDYNLNRRVIIPCYWQNEIVGYTARSWDPTVKTKYHSQYDKSFVFNTDKQAKDWKYVIACEGPFDAMSIDGVAFMGNEVSEEQVDLIDSLGKEIIVVPDFDVKKNKKWAGKMLIDQAIEYGWAVSFPVWHETCKDVNEAVVKYGKLFVLQSILKSKITNKLKIEILKRKVISST
jgi:hypothetical protein